MLKFFAAKNLVDTALTEIAPWEWETPDFDRVKQMSKLDRRKFLQLPAMKWNVYSPVRSLNPLLINGANNPAIALRGFVADFDAVMSQEDAHKMLGGVSEKLRPTFLEESLSGKIHGVWVFENEALVVDNDHASKFLEEFASFVGAATMLPGYDPASTKPSQRWTNGVRWHTECPNPVSSDIVTGLVIRAAKRLSSVSRGEVPLDFVGAEVEKRFPGRWHGDFTLDATGVRFWDTAADNSTGCQVKLDGMLCFTGKVPFVRWHEIFGREWVDEQAVVNLGKASEGILYDGKNYWRMASGIWVKDASEDIQRVLRTKGVRNIRQKDETASELDRVMVHIQTAGRVKGSAPMVNFRPGVVEVSGERMLNTTTIRAAEPASVPGDWPWIRGFIEGHFVQHEGMKPLDHFYAWLQRAFIALRTYKPLMGQAVFLCGPKHNGKTLLNIRIAGALLGGRTANPYSYMVGDTQFTEDLFHSYLWAINDEEAPAHGSARSKFLSRLKAFVVNPQHNYEPKFCPRVSIPHTGRMFMTLNDDPDSVSFLPEVNGNTRDKLMFFASQEFKNVWGTNEWIESKIEQELPHFAGWLLNWTPPADVLEHSRCGVKSYFDPGVLNHAHQQAYAFNFRELLSAWAAVAVYWDESTSEWSGTPTELMSQLAVVDSLAVALKEWKVSTIAKAMTSLAKISGSGIEHIDGEGRRFKIQRDALI